MSISPEEKKRYFQETAIALQREGFRIEPSVGGRLGVWLDDHRSISITTPSASFWAIPIGNAGSTGVTAITECLTATGRHCSCSRPMRTSGAESSGSLTAAALTSSQSGSPASSRSCTASIRRQRLSPLAAATLPQPISHPRNWSQMRRSN